MNNKKKHLKKILSLLLSGVLVIGGMGIAVHATGAKDTSAKKETVKQTVSPEEKTEISKDETVYIIAGADGAVNKVIVSDWIKNAIASDKIQDQTDLENVVNVKGDETYTLDGDNIHVWDAQGNDIYYQGDIKKELPVDIAVSYKLDGNTVSAEELAGKSGKVTIRFDYTNHQYEMVDIDGKQEKMYVPFAMLTGIILDNDNFKNVEISNGKLINDGDRIILIGMAFPGVSDNLKLEEDKLNIPDYVEITADATDFEMAASVTIATNELFNHVDFDDVDDLEGLSDSLDELTDAMDQLIDGSSKLYDGLDVLLDKSGEMKEGINQLVTGAGKLAKGNKDLDGGAAQLQSGAAKLAGGLDTLSSNNTTLNGGAKQVFESLLSMANTQLADAGLTVKKLTIDNYATVLNGVLSSLDEKTVYKLAYDQAYSKVEEAVRAQETVIRTKVEAAVREKVLEGVLKAAGQPMTAKQYEAAVNAGKIPADAQAKINAAVEGQMAQKEIQKQITKNTEQQIKDLTEQKMGSEEVKAQINKAVESAKSGASGIASLKTQLDGYNQFYQGLITYTGGVAEASSGARELKNATASLKKGTTGLKNGAEELYTGLGALQEGSGALIDGVAQLKDGALQLSDGLKEFNEKGVQKLIDAVDGDLDGLLTRIRATADVSKDYKSFAGISDEMDGSVKFIYKTGAVEMPENDNE
jgi:putative membrane protein